MPPRPSRPKEIPKTVFEKSATLKEKAYFFIAMLEAFQLKSYDPHNIRNPKHVVNATVW